MQKQNTARSASTTPETAPRCPSCDAPDLDIVLEHDVVPVHSCRLVDTREEALAFPSGVLRIGFCRSCGFITNTSYDPSLQDYGVSYEETQGFSRHFRAFADDLAARWVAKYDLHRKHIVEVGCGKGEFLVTMCAIGDSRGVGIDPAFVDARLADEHRDRVHFIEELYSEDHLDLPADALVCRHTLEHIHPVADFLRLARRAAVRRPDTVVLFELPDVVRVLREVAFWDIYYEHCSYFSPGSLARLFRGCGFDVLDLALDFDDQYILIEARAGKGVQPAHPLEESVQELAAEVGRFRARYAETIARWRALLAQQVATGKRTVVWGAGSKGVSFLTTLEVGDEIAYAVDINPFKHGKYMAGTGHRIVAPEFLSEYRPDLVILMNPVYTEEVGEHMRAMGVDAEVVAV